MIFRLKKFIAVLCAALSAFALCACAAAGYAEYSSVAFSSDIIFTARIVGGRPKYAFDKMTKLIAEIDAQASLTKDSDLAEFNRADVGERVEVGEHCYALFGLAMRYYELTSGAFNPALAPLGELWHVSADSIPDTGLGDGLVLPSLSDVNAVLENCDPNAVIAEKNAADGRCYLVKKSPVRLDFGGIAKGYAVDLCVRILDEYGVNSALLDISGNAYFYGGYVSNAQSDAWRVGVVSPRPRVQSGERKYVCAVSVDGGNSAVTSGDYMRYYVNDGVYIPHIIGRDGVPIGVTFDGESWVNSGEPVISATVIGQSSAVCDALSTAVCALGLERGLELLKKLGYKGLIFTEKRYTIIGSELYRPDRYDGHLAYERYEP